MENKDYTKITIEVGGKEKITCEFPSSNITVDEICQAFRTLMVGLTFADDTAGDMIASYLEEYYGDKYNVVNING